VAEKKEAEAEKAKIEASQLKDSKAKFDALEKADADKQAAIKEATEAALAEQKAIHDAQIAKEAAEREQERIEHERKQ